MQRYAFFPNCNKNMQNINHFLIFSNTFNPKKETPTQKSPQKKIRVLRAAPSAPINPHKKIPTQKNPLKKNPSAPSCSECSTKSPTQNPPPPQKSKKKIATREAGSNHYIKQLLSLKQKIQNYSWNLKFLTNAPISPSLIIASTSAFFNLPTYLKSFSSPVLPAFTNSTTAGISALSSSSIGSQ